MKNIEFDTKKECFVKSEVGKELLKIEIIRPIIIKNEEKRIKVERVFRFCDEIVNNCKKYAENALFEKIKCEYEAESDFTARRKFKKYIYKIECNVIKGENSEDFIFSILEVKLIRAGRVLEKRNISHKWNVKRGIMVPIKNKKKNEKKGKQTT